MMARLVGVAAKTIQRWEASGSLPADPVKRHILSQIQEIAELGLKVYTPEGLTQFLKTPLPVFAGLTALQMIQIGRGDEVMSVLAADYEGIGF
jgi:hypothetical protein